MDAVKFLEIYSRMCNKYSDCVGCPMRGELLCQCDDRKYSHEESERMVEIVENWNRENPEEIGKKYIIEIDRVEHATVINSTNGDYSHKIYHIKDGPWINEGTIARLKEYKESEKNEE